MLDHDLANHPAAEFRDSVKVDKENASYLIDEQAEIEAEKKADRVARRLRKQRDVILDEAGEESSLRTDASLTLESESVDLEEIEARSGYFKPVKSPDKLRNVKYLYRQLLHQRRLVSQRQQRRQLYLTYVEKLNNLHKAIRNGTAPSNMVKIQKAIRELSAVGTGCNPISSAKSCSVHGEHERPETGSVEGSVRSLRSNTNPDGPALRRDDNHVAMSRKLGRFQ